MPTEQYPELEALQRNWALRILLLPHRFGDDAHDNALRALIRHLGVSADWPKPDPLKFVRQALAQSGIATPPDAAFSKPLRNNLLLLQGRFRLSSVARDLLGYAILLGAFPFLRQLCQLLPVEWEAEIDAALATLLGYQAREVTAALEGGPLIEFGLMQAGGNGLARLSDRVYTDELFARRMLAPASAVSELADDLVSVVVGPDLHDIDFSYLPGQTALATGYLREAIRDRRQGANVLLIGSAGVGKTAFARHIAHALGVRLIKPMITSQTPYGPSQERAWKWQVAQSLYAKEEGCVFLFDEIEDMSQSYRSYAKPWWHEARLEQAPIPTIWEVREVNGVARAFVERFDVVLKIDEPTGEARRALLMKLTNGLSVASSIERWMDMHPLNIKVLSRALTAARIAVNGDSQMSHELAVETALAGASLGDCALDGRW